jgi:hypothetical protein
MGSLQEFFQGEEKTPKILLSKAKILGGQCPYPHWEVPALNISDKIS